MSDPKLASSKVVITYRADDGYRSEENYSSVEGRKGWNGEVMRAEGALLTGLEELARLTALFGFEDKALEVFTAARDRVFKFREERAGQ